MIGQLKVTRACAFLSKSVWLKTKTILLLALNVIHSNRLLNGSALVTAQDDGVSV